MFAVRIRRARPSLLAKAVTWARCLNSAACSSPTTVRTEQPTRANHRPTTISTAKPTATMSADGADSCHRQQRARSASSVAQACEGKRGAIANQPGLSPHVARR
eukprot:8532109-Alexandrium_andersonii.AAC.1